MNNLLLTVLMAVILPVHGHGIGKNRVHHFWAGINMQYRVMVVREDTLGNPMYEDSARTKKQILYQSDYYGHDLLVYNSPKLPFKSYRDEVYGYIDSTHAFVVDEWCPKKIDNLFVKARTRNSVTLTWCSYGDLITKEDYPVFSYAKLVRIYGYDLRYSLSPIDSTNWNSAITVVTPAPGVPTDVDRAWDCKEATILSLLPNTDYWFAIRAIDLYGNLSPISNIKQTKTLQ